jgi:hypothetical protein
MIGAFTGPEGGMTERQQEELTGILQRQDIRELHVGDCIGADAEATQIAQDLSVGTVCHPPDKDAKRAFTRGHLSVREPRPYLVRNHDMVDAAQFLIGTPDGPERLRSGTWATIRYALKQHVPTVIIWPDGSCDWLLSQPG